MPPQHVGAGGQGDGPDETRSDLALVRTALRQDWPIPPEVKRQLLQRAIDICDPESEAGAGARPRLVLGALKIIAMYANLSLKQQVADIARERLELSKGGSGSTTLAELVAEAEQAAAEHRPAERPA